MDPKIQATSIKDFINDISKETLKLQTNEEVRNKEKYDIKSRISRYKDDQCWLMDASRESVDLATVRKRKDCINLRASNVRFRRKCTMTLKYGLSDAPWKHAMFKKEQEKINTSTKVKKKRKKRISKDKIKSKDSEINVSVEEEGNAIKNKVSELEVIITLYYHRPIYSRQKLTVQREIQVLGSTLLTDLRDFLPCYKDDLLIHPVRSLNKNEYSKENQSYKSRFKSGYLFIENVFYNDLRDSTSIDYSRVVLDMVEKKKYASDFTKADMNGVRMGDLCFKQHESYLYCHQGNCEHIITITDVRLLNPRFDITDPTKYPLTTHKRQERKGLCRSCNLVNAQWVVTKNELCPEIPCYLCEECVKMLCFNEKDELLDPDTEIYFFPPPHT